MEKTKQQCPSRVVASVTAALSAAPLSEGRRVLRRWFAGTSEVEQRSQGLEEIERLVGITNHRLVFSAREQLKRDAQRAREQCARKPASARAPREQASKSADGVIRKFAHHEPHLSWSQ